VDITQQNVTVVEPPGTGSALITTLAEAVAYYHANLALAHDITCRGRPVRIVFERDATHLYSVSVDDWTSIPAHLRVIRTIGRGKQETREFSLERAQLMDRVLPAISNFTFSIPGTGHKGQQNRMLHGPALPSGHHMRVVLRPGPGEAWTCVSAYRVTSDVWLACRRSKQAKFPP